RIPASGLLRAFPAQARRSLMPDAFFASRFIPCDDPRFPSSHAATIAETMDGDLVAAWYAGSREGAPDVAILSSRLRRGGRLWPPPRVIVDTPGRSEGNPVVFRDIYGTLWLFWVTMTGEGWESCIVRAIASCDSGHSWDIPRMIQETPGWMTRHKAI